MYSSYIMRTTIEMSDEQRAQLLQIAARRGMKGFSALVQEALDAYLKGNAGKNEEVRAAVAARGSLKGKDGDRLEDACRQLRSHWR
jgi:Arc/MetJ family transcription regulator